MICMMAKPFVMPWANSYSLTCHHQVHSEIYMACGCLEDKGPLTLKPEYFSRVGAIVAFLRAPCSALVQMTDSP